MKLGATSIGIALLTAACSSTPDGQKEVSNIGNSPAPMENVDEIRIKDFDAIQSDWVGYISQDNSAAPLESLGSAAAANLVEEPSLLEVYIFSIGQADSMLFVGPPPEHRTLLVDLGQPTGGSDQDHFVESGSASAEHVRQRIIDIVGKPHVDYFLLSHYHSDHVGKQGDRPSGWGSGMVRLLSNNDYEFSVGTFIHVQESGSEYIKESRSTYSTIDARMPYWKQIGKVGNEAKPSFGSDQIRLGEGVEVEIVGFGGLAPDGTSAFDTAVQHGANYDEAPGNENDLSIALKVSAGEFELFTAGDLNGTDDPSRRPYYVEREFGETYTNIEWHLVNYWERTGQVMDVEVYRANHHGSNYSSTEKLLDALDPEFVIYSTGAQYGHPDTAVINAVATTAQQFATTAVADSDGFAGSGGEVIGEVTIAVAVDGLSYSLKDHIYRAFTDSEEADHDDEKAVVATDISFTGSRAAPYILSRPF